MDHLNVIRVGQLYGDGNLYEGVHLVEQFIPGRIFTFRINGKFHTFQNYTLTHADTDICSPCLNVVSSLLLFGFIPQLSWVR